MEKFLLCLTIITVLFLIADREKINNYNLAVKTPSQVEMSNSLNKPDKYHSKNILNQNSIENQMTPKNLFNERMKLQQNNNIPQSKQPKPLTN